VYTGYGPYHIQDGIHGPDFVEVNLIDRGPVHAGFGKRQPIKHLETRLFNGWFQITGVDDGLDIGQMSVVVTVMMLIDDDMDLTAADPFLDHLLRLEVVMVQVQFGEFRLQFVDVQAGIDQSPQDHVSAGTGKAVEIRYFHPKPPQFFDDTSIVLSYFPSCFL
jgi:hypothetical protein